MSEQQSRASPMSIDWEGVFEKNNKRPWEPVGPTKISTITMLEAEGVSTTSEASEIVTDAVEKGILESTGDGYVIADATKPDEDSSGEGTGEKPQQQFSAQNQSKNSQEAESSKTEGRKPDSGFSHKTEKGSEDSVESNGVVSDEMLSRIESMEARMNALSKKLTSVKEENEVLRDGLSSVVGLDSDASSRRLVQEAERVADRFNGVEERSKQNEMRLDELGDADEDGSMSTSQRITAIRKELVTMNEGKRRGMDYNAIWTLFRGLGAEVSQSWCSQLLDKAADGHEAFYTRTFDDNRNKQIRVKMELVPEDSVYREGRSSN